MKRNCLKIGLLILLPFTATAGNLDTTELIFEEREPVVPEAYLTRMLLTDDFLRMDDGGDDDDYLLYDRNAGKIYSVNHEDQRVVVVEPTARPISEPETYRHESRVIPAELPEIGGNKVVRLQHFTNDEMCFEVYAAEGLLTDAVEALTGFAQILAYQHAATIADIPAEFQSACDLVNNVYQPARYLSNGFPVRQRDYQGRSRVLQSFRKDIQKDEQLFVIPDNYHLFYPGKTPI